ncbi:hypothetical protein [Aminipila luticellarii]|uniref:Uncharacterized protein n=1 Tax=Aminipila luticellarii TaxID=2507160 RepID=A0A410PXJ2_9FIRM|nr:hypothetical protein [Aminipila luticellarii]QAT43668.1 hypothetical protein EQM06_10785 [Aminipila luticellarii]
MTTYYGSNKNRDNHYYNSSEDYYDDMSHPVSTCSRFERRHDFSTFNMSDYMSCENCRHLSADNECIAREDTNIGRME